MSVLRFNTATDDRELQICKARIILTLRTVGTPECAIKAPASILDIYQDQDCEGKLTTWTLAAFELEHEGRIETWGRNGQLYLKFTDEYLRECGMTKLGTALGLGQQHPHDCEPGVAQAADGVREHSHANGADLGQGDEDDRETSMWRRMWEVAFP